MRSNYSLKQLLVCVIIKICFSKLVTLDFAFFKHLYLNKRMKKYNLLNREKLEKNSLSYLSTKY